VWETSAEIMRKMVKIINYGSMNEKVSPPTFNIPSNIQEKANQKIKDKENKHNIKNLGQVSTPASIVDFMLDTVIRGKLYSINIY
jgi:hypothetical protein